MAEPDIKFTSKSCLSFYNTDDIHLLKHALVLAVDNTYDLEDLCEKYKNLKKSVAKAMCEDDNPIHIDIKVEKKKTPTTKDYEYYDPETNLEWKTWDDIDTNWYVVKHWVDGLGDGWKMPTTRELKTLYRECSDRENIPLELKTTGWYIWSDEIKADDSSSVCSICLENGRVGWDYCNNSFDMRGFAVRKSRRIREKE